MRSLSRGIDSGSRLGALDRARSDALLDGIHGALRGSFYASTAAAGDEAAGGPTGQAAGAVPVAGASSCSSSSLGCGPRNGQLGERSLPILSKIDFQASLDLVI